MVENCRHDAAVDVARWRRHLITEISLGPESPRLEPRQSHAQEGRKARHPVGVPDHVLGDLGVESLLERDEPQVESVVGHQVAPPAGRAVHQDLGPTHANQLLQPRPQMHAVFVDRRITR